MTFWYWLNKDPKRAFLLLFIALGMIMLMLYIAKEMGVKKAFGIELNAENDGSPTKEKLLEERQTSKRSSQQTDEDIEKFARSYPKERQRTKLPGENKINIRETLYEKGIKKSNPTQDKYLPIFDPELEKAIKNSLTRLTKYINDCATEDIDKPSKEEKIDVMMIEFVEGATMEVSTLFGGVKTMKVRDYFTKLVYLKEINSYTDISFEFSDLKPLSISKISENTFLANGEYTQKFEAFRSGKRVYSDITIKFSEIFAQKNSNGWKTKFRDTKVISTFQILEQ